MCTSNDIDSFIYIISIYLTKFLPKISSCLLFGTAGNHLYLGSPYPTEMSFVHLYRKCKLMTRSIFTIYIVVILNYCFNNYILVLYLNFLGLQGPSQNKMSRNADY